MATNVRNGKGFEYAVLDAFREALSSVGVLVEVAESAAYRTAASAFMELGDKEQANFKAAARAAAQIIEPLEPRLSVGKSPAPLVLHIQKDRKGEEGDVRDIVCIRSAEGWEIGISCKHNHKGMKHSRHTVDADFGSTWVGVPCSQDFFGKIAKVMELVEKWEGTLWREHSNKQKDVYQPVLDAYAAEIKRICDADHDAPARLVHYFLGVQDFYQVIAKDKRARNSAITIELVAFNLNGTLGQAAAGKRPLHKVKRVILPDRLLDISMKKNSRTTLVLTFSDAWTVSMRIHNGDKFVKRTGLKWEIKLDGYQENLFNHTQPVPAAAS